MTDQTFSTDALTGPMDTVTGTRLYDFQPRAKGRYQPRGLAHAPCVVCVPAKNEAKRLPGFLSALSMAFRALDTQRGLLVIALDGCTDDSRAVVDAWIPHFPVDIHIIELPPHPEPHAGRVRRAALQHGAQAFPLEDVILFTTDADTLVDRKWLCATRALMSETDFVCGDIWRDDEAGNVVRAPHEHHYHALHRARRRIDPVAFDSADPHPQGYGASLAMRRDVYADIGGCPSIPCNEDTAMVRRARQQGYRVRQDRRVKVLDAEARAGKPFMIVDPRRYLELYRLSSDLRTGFARNRPGRVERAVEALGLDRLTVEEAWTAARSADAFVAQVLPDPEFEPDMPLDLARSLLERAGYEGGRKVERPAFAAPLVEAV
jgi:hypothetical protein